MFKELSQWYVYELVDPMTGRPFYVGKGKGNRIDDHEYEAAKGVCSHKCNKIRSIINSGNNVIKTKIAYFWDEKAAYEYEAHRILSYGLDALTNVVVGGTYSWSKPEKKSMECMKIIEAWAGQFAYWLLHSEGGKRNAVVEGLAPVYKAIMENFYNSFAPSTFNVVMKEEKNRLKAVEIFRPYGINLVFDGG